MSGPCRPVSEKTWEEEDYARQLSRAEEIRNNPKKMRMAKAGARRMAKEKLAEAKALKRLASKPVAKKSGKKVVKKAVKRTARGLANKRKV